MQQSKEMGNIYCICKKHLLRSATTICGQAHLQARIGANDGVLDVAAVLHCNIVHEDAIDNPVHHSKCMRPPYGAHGTEPVTGM